MNRAEFGKLIAMLRREIFAADGNRLTQRGLAEVNAAQHPQSALTEIVIGKVERGEKANLEPESLSELADALELTLGERQLFFLLGNGLENPQIYPSDHESEETIASVLAILDDIQVPALLVDRYLDVIALNKAVAKLYQIPVSLIKSLITSGADFNLLSFIFSAAFKPVRDQMSGDNWHRFAVGNVIYFRRMTLPYRLTPYYSRLMKQLGKNREFRWFWDQARYEEKINFVGGESFERRMESGGRMCYLTTPLVTLTPYGNLEIVVHLPRDRTTADTFNDFGYSQADNLIRLSSWPDKRF